MSPLFSLFHLLCRIVESLQYTLQKMWEAIKSEKKDGRILMSYMCFCKAEEIKDRERQNIVLW